MTEVARVASPLERRGRDLERLGTETWDLVVVGGGIVGAGILLDATSRGLRAALIEQDDIASGTSSRSSRLIHGGLRYLQQYQVGIVRESLAERSRLLDLAPHLVSLRPLLFALYGRPMLTRAYYGAGIGFYELLGLAKHGGRSRHLSRRATLELAPALRSEGLQGGIVYHDAVDDDARMALAVVRTAVKRGAVAATRARATGTLQDGGRAFGVRVHDRLGDVDLEVRARRIVDATGVWAARPDAPLGAGASLVPSRGAHLVVPRERIPVRHAMTFQVPHLTVFLVPWPDAWLIGTTDEPWLGPPARPAATADEVIHLLGAVNRFLDVDLKRHDVVGTFAGLRPLVGDTGAGATVRMSREHRIRVDGSGVVHVSGGKYTTYRVMAADTVDAALGDEAGARPSATADLPIQGAAARADLRALAGTFVSGQGLDERTALRLVARHGTEASAVVAMGARLDLLRPLVPGRPHLEAEVVWAVREEAALDLDDMLARRFRLAPELVDRGASIAPRVAALMGAELGWDEARRAREVEAYLATAGLEYGVPDVDASP